MRMLLSLHQSTVQSRIQGYRMKKILTLTLSMALATCGLQANPPIIEMTQTDYEHLIGDCTPSMPIWVCMAGLVSLTGLASTFCLSKLQVPPQAELDTMKMLIVGSLVWGGPALAYLLLQ